MTDNTASPSLDRIRNDYKDRHARFFQQAETFRAAGRRVENLRGLSFALGVVGVGFYFGSDNVALGLVGLVSFVAFFWLVQHHNKVLDKESHARRFALVNEHGLKRHSGEWHDLPRAGTTFLPPNHEYAEDLDLFGVASLYQRISVAHTRFGQQTLANWIAHVASHEEILSRQRAVTELSEKMEFRQSLEAEGMALVEKRAAGETTQLSDGPNPSRLLSWVGRTEDLSTFPWAFLAFGCPVIFLVAVVGVVQFDLPPLTWVAALVLNLIVLRAVGAHTTEAFAAVSTTEGAFLRYGNLLELLEGFEPESDWLKSRWKKLHAKDQAEPSAIMRQFRGIVSWYDLRHNGMVYPFVNSLLLWDLHCTLALQKWRRRAGGNLEHWFDIIGEYEALSSLAGLLADDPDARLPRVLDPTEREVALSGRGVGHPLLSIRQRVKNDVEPFGPGSALLVTGSNMSGKSTFLRTLGVNAVLAFMGGPTIAEQFELPLCKIGTSIRIADSLRSGVSHFYAEVQRLATIVGNSATSDLPVLFLLDEILHGTNSRERQIGARWVLAELLSTRAFGIVTTHDMELCRLPEPLMRKVRQHHFREIERNGEMSFDYKLREGPVTSGNALRLMQRVGLGVPLEDTSFES